MAPRLRRVRRADAADSVLAHYDRIFGDRDPVEFPGTATGTPGDWWTVLALVPEILDHNVRGVALLYQERARLDPVLRELAVVRAGWVGESLFVFVPHCKIGIDVGLTAEQIDAIPSWPTADCFTPLQRSVLAFTDAIVLARGRVTEGDFAALKTSLSDEAILELTYAISLYAMQATISRALRLEFDDRDDPMRPARQA